MPELSTTVLAILDELTEQLAQGEPVSVELLEQLRGLWKLERPSDVRGFEVLHATLTARQLSSPGLERLSAPSALESRTRGHTRRGATYPKPELATPLGDDLNDEPAPSDGWKYPVFFATNRVPLDPADVAKGFRARRSNSVIRGRCDVWVPAGRRFGELGSPWWRRWLRGQFKDDHLRLEQTTRLDGTAFADQARAVMAGAAGERHALVYLHGYCTTFDDAALRAAQLGFDLQVSGATAFFAWPSQGNVAGYPADGAAIEASEGAIGRFLADFANESGADVVHVVAHSMGNRGLLRALQRLASDALTRTNVRFGQLFLAAPDVDRDLFLDLAELYRTFAARTTLYASRSDRAVQASSWLHGAARAGFLPPITVVSPDHRLDTIAVPDLDLDTLGHSYFAGNSLLQDMFELIRHGTPPERRQRLVRKQAYWEFQH